MAVLSFSKPLRATFTHSFFFWPAGAFIFPSREEPLQHISRDCLSVELSWQREEEISVPLGTGGL